MTKPANPWSTFIKTLHESNIRQAFEALGVTDKDMDAWCVVSTFELWEKLRELLGEPPRGSGVLLTAFYPGHIRVVVYDALTARAYRFRFNLLEDVRPFAVAVPDMDAKGFIREMLPSQHGEEVLGDQMAICRAWGTSPCWN